MESLIQYKRLLLKHKPERTDLVEACEQLLETLKSIDPMRRRRYEELGSSRSPP
jgi:geranylgeranyl transferase type-2 subunit alpha